MAFKVLDSFFAEWYNLAASIKHHAGDDRTDFSALDAVIGNLRQAACAFPFPDIPNICEFACLATPIL